MHIRNFYNAPAHMEPSHAGKGEVKNVRLFGQEDFSTGLSFIIYTEIEPGCSIGYHTHDDNEEVYVILDGQGSMTVDGETRPVSRGDVIVNRPGGSHGLENDSPTTLRLLVFEVQR